ncbi:hypothetical protein QUA80_32170, partial [Microcoleus sp. F4-D5]
ASILSNLYHQSLPGGAPQAHPLNGYVLAKGCLTPSQRQIIRRVHNYLKIHENHITYKSFEAEAIPRGSGMVESACKWLIQQRFKGVGMRWSSEGFNHLLHLRLAWVNGRFDDLFSDANFFSNSGSSPNF